MSDYKYGNWFCRPANEAEAREIVARAVASGAKLLESVSYWAHTSLTHPWDLFGGWGVRNGRTYTGDTHASWATSRAKEYTIKQVREKFPLPDGSMKERKDVGLPAIGTKVRVCLGRHSSARRKDGEVAKILSLSVNSKGVPMAMIEITGEDGECASLPVECLEPITNERDQWTIDAVELVGGNRAVISVETICKTLFDAMSSNKLKAPEVSE